MEKSFLMIKPGFVNEKIYYAVLNEIRQNKDLTVFEMKVVKYQDAEASLHYLNKKDTSYYKELREYLSSGVALGVIVIGDNVIEAVDKLKHKLRKKLPVKFKLETDKMRNIIHASDSQENANKEIEIFNSLKRIDTNYVFCTATGEQISPYYETKEHALKDILKYQEASKLVLYNNNLKKAVNEELIGGANYG